MYQPLTGVKISQCHKCFRVFGPDDEKYSYYKCDHSVCLSCFVKLGNDKEHNINCNICDSKSLFHLESGVPIVHVECVKLPKYGGGCCMRSSRRDDRSHMVPAKSLLDASRDSKSHPDRTVVDSDKSDASRDSRSHPDLTVFDSDVSDSGLRTPPQKNLKDESHSNRSDIDNETRLLSEATEKNRLFEEENRRLEILFRKCSKCEIRAEEKDLYICETCYEEEKIDVKADDHAICANCTIRNHIREGHKTLDLSEYKKKLSDAHDEMKLKLDVFEADQLECTIALAEFFSLVEVLRTKNEELLNQARRSRSKKSLENTFEKMKIFMEKSKNVMAKTSSELAKHAEDAETFKSERKTS